MYWKFVENLSNKNDKYWFVNEVEIRLATWMTLVFALFSFFLVLFKWEFIISFVLMSTIWVDFMLKVFMSPNLSIFWNIAKLFIKNKPPIWVGAVQKSFAWSIWLFLSTFVMFCMLMLWSYIYVWAPELLQLLNNMDQNIKNAKLIVTPFNPAMLACVMCLIFMWLESVVWYCVGCSLYLWLVKKWWMKSYKWQNCANWECNMG